MADKSRRKGEKPKKQRDSQAKPRPKVEVDSLSTDRRPTRDQATEPQPNPDEPIFPVVGIGASAGGLEALKRFFSAMPAQPGMAFVLVPHLDPTHKSMMVELLSKQTQLQVGEAVENEPLEPNHVYVIPPNRYLAIRKRRFHLKTPETGRPMAIAIDGFFRSLAEDQKERAVGVVLSGTGDHGVAGLREVKQAGGMVIAQRPDTADFDRMPRAAIEAHVVDSILPPEEMPQAIVEFVKRFYRTFHTEEQLEPDQEQAEQLDSILVLLHNRTKADFRHYRKAMLLRRIRRRMDLRQIDGMTDYLGLLRSDDDETTSLYKDLLIGITSFFREREAFEVLERNVIPQLVEQCNGRPARVWVPACSTGEEAYSLAMLLVEGFAAARKAPSIQIFATDVDADALQVARTGIYGECVVADVTQERLKRFFTKIDEQHYQVAKQLREMIIFAEQNLISDAPYSKLDLLSCRNLLIYLEPEMQQKIIALFHFVLTSGGVLLLGQSESVGRSVDLFEPISKKWRVFRRTGRTRQDRVEIPILSDFQPKATAERSEQGARPAVVFSRLMQKALLDDYAPASVLVNSHFQVLCQQGPLNAYLEFHSGEPTRDLLSLVRSGLRVKLRAAVDRAVRENTTVVDSSVRVKRDDGYMPCTITVKPVHEPRGADGLLLISFIGREEPPAEPAAEGHEIAAEHESTVVKELEDELRTTRDELQSTIDELEGSQSELKISHEEVMSMNEELQSANEELETSKEELQSLNEELTTVNSQLQAKVEELERASSDISNLLASTDIAVVFLDTALRIRRFTPRAATLLSLLATDIGRPYRDLSPKFGDVSLLGDSQHVLKNREPAEREVWTDGEHAYPGYDAPKEESASPARCYLRRIRPYINEKMVEGVVITFVDITERIKTEQLQRQLLEVAEQEQQRIGQDLHDSTQQELAGLGMIAHGLFDALSAKRDDDHAKVAERLSKGIGRSLENIRRLSRELIPAEIGSLGMGAALEELCKQTAESGAVKCQFHSSGNNEIRNQLTATHLYRIAQEAISNSIKHADARHIRVTLESNDHFTTLKIVDDGSGVPIPPPTTKGIGLKLMSHRAALIGGTLRVERLEKGGTQVLCTVPVA